MINIEITNLLNIREEWVKAYFLDMIARLSAKSGREALDAEEVMMLEYARNKILEAHMLAMLDESAVTSDARVTLTVIKGGRID